MTHTETKLSRAADTLLELAEALRDEGQDAVRALAEKALKQLDGDPVAAVSLAACLINVDAELNIWWQKQPDQQLLALAPRTRVETIRRPGLAPCGTDAAVRRHRRNGTALDADCQAAVRRRAPAACGTRAGFMRHKDRGEQIDDACREAERTYQRIRARARRAGARDANAVEDVAA